MVQPVDLREGDWKKPEGIATVNEIDKIIKTVELGESAWSEPMTAEEVIELIGELTNDKSTEHLHSDS